MESGRGESSTNSNTTGAGQRLRRGRSNLEPIQNAAACNATFRKRSKGLLKKIEELSTLCGIQSAAIIFGPEEAAPEVWPSVEGMVDTFERLHAMPEKEQMRNMMNKEKYLSSCIAKTTMQVEKVQRENAEAECTALMFRCIADMGRVQQLDLPATMSLAWMVDAKMQTVKDRIEILREQQKKNVAAMQPAVGNTQLSLMEPMQQILVPELPPAVASMQPGMVTTQLSSLASMLQPAVMSHQQRQGGGIGTADQVLCPPEPSIPAHLGGSSRNPTADTVIDPMDDSDDYMKLDDLSWLDHYYPK